MREGKISITPERLVEIIDTFVQEDSEGGRRAQAVVAGLLDVFADPGRVVSGRINDPSRKYPGDVCVCATDELQTWEKAFEVRDKPVTATDVQIFAKRCIDMGVREVAVVMVSRIQKPLDELGLTAWASGYGIGLTLFHGWRPFVGQILFWAAKPKPEGAVQAVGFIEKRLIAVEATTETVKLWQTMSLGDS